MLRTAILLSLYNDLSLFFRDIKTQNTNHRPRGYLHSPELPSFPVTFEPFFQSI